MLRKLESVPPGHPSVLGIRSPFATPADRTVTFRAMASDVTLRVSGPTKSAAAALDRAQSVFERVHSTCTRFDPTSSLMRANAAGNEWAVVEPECFHALEAALSAHERTSGAFDPRVLRTLVDAGYDRTLPFESAAVTTTAKNVAGSAAAAPSASGPWSPEFDLRRLAVRVGPDPIDLGGIGKGLAVRWAARELAGVGGAFLVEAGGDCHAGGPGPDGTGWRIAVEDPFGAPDTDRAGSAAADPVAVLQVANRACATSSIRIRRWRQGGKAVHHLIDPRTGRPGGAGLQAVTVVGSDAADAEVWSKALFLAGEDGISALAERQSLAALWVGTDGSLGRTGSMDEFVIWLREPDGVTA